MSEINYTYQHEDFNLSLAYYYTLVLQVNSTDFTYAVFYDDKLMALATHCSLEELANPEEMADELFANFKYIVVGVGANGFTLVPVDLYSQERVADFARFLDVKEDDKVFSQQLDANNFIVYKTTTAVADAIEKFDFYRCVYGSKGWINAIANTNPPDNAIYINIEDGFAELLCFKSGKIRLYNTFNYKTPDDLTYAASVVFAETGVSQKDISLILSGTALNEDYQQRLSEFFPVVEINTIKIAELPDGHNSGQLLKLSALLLCVSSEAH